MTMMLLLGFWTLVWAALNIFNISNTEGDQLKSEESRLFAVAHGICYSVSSFVELVILLLLCSSSIGKNNFNRSWFVASFWAMLTFLTSVCVIFLKSGPNPAYWISRNIELVELVRSILTVCMNVAAMIFYYITRSDRVSMTRYSKYLIVMYSCLSLARGLEFANDFLSVNIGCSPDWHPSHPFFRYLHDGFLGNCPFFHVRSCRISHPQKRLSILEH